MIHLTESIVEYLLISSVLLLILGGIVFFKVKFLKIKGEARLWIYAMIVFLPLVYPVKTFFPEVVKVPVHLNASKFSYFLYNKISHEGTLSGISPNPGNHPYAAYEAEDSNAEYTRDKISIPAVLKTRFMEAVTGTYRNWRLIITIVWGMIFLFLSIRLIITGFRSNRLLRVAEPVVNPQILKLLNQCALKTDLHHIPELFKVEGISTPMVMGFFKPRMIIPRHLLKADFREGLQFAFLHELKHLRQHHNWWLLIESIIGAAYFFHPVIHWAKTGIHEELEHICDRHVIKVTGKSVSYADFLLNEIWRQNLSTNPALSLPFLSGASQTTNRIHLILAHASPAPFSEIRSRLAVLPVLTVFSSILIFSVVPSVQKPKQPLRALNPVKVDYRESKVIGPVIKRIVPDKENISIEKPSGRIRVKSVDIGNRKHIPNTVNAIEIPPVRGEEENTVKPLKNSGDPAINMADVTIGIPEVPGYKVEPVQPEDTSVSGNISQKSFTAAKNESGKSRIPDKPEALPAMAEKYLGAPVNALTIHRISDIKILDEYTVLFIMYGGDMYLSRLSAPCPALLYASDFKLLSSTDRVSMNDRIQPISFNQILGTTGMLGAFYPYKYEGQKSEAVRLLKNSLLKKLAAENAFSD